MPKASAPIRKYLLIAGGVVGLVVLVIAFAIGLKHRVDQGAWALRLLLLPITVGLIVSMLREICVYAVTKRTTAEFYFSGSSAEDNLALVSDSERPSFFQRVLLRCAEAFGYVLAFLSGYVACSVLLAAYLLH